MLEDAGAWRQYREHPETFRFPGGESLADQQRRVLASLRDVARDGRPALLVTHGGSIRLVRCFLRGRGIVAFHDADRQRRPRRDRDLRSRRAHRGGSSPDGDRAAGAPKGGGRASRPARRREEAGHPRPAGDRPGEGPQDLRLPYRLAVWWPLPSWRESARSTPSPTRTAGRHETAAHHDLGPHHQGRRHRGPQAGARARRPRQLALHALRAQLPREEDGAAHVQRRRQRHRRHRRRLGHDQLHRRHLAGRRPQVLLAARRGVVRARSRSRAAPPTSRASRSTSARPAPAQDPARCSAPWPEPHDDVLVGHRQGRGARHPQPRQGKAQTANEYRKTFCADGRLAAAAHRERSGSSAGPTPCKRYSDLYRTVYAKGLDPTAQGLLREDAAVDERSGRDAADRADADQSEAAQDRRARWAGPSGTSRSWTTWSRSSRTYDFVFVDITDISSFDADPDQWYDGVHMTTVNTRRAIDYVLKETGGMPAVTAAEEAEGTAMLFNSFGFLLVFLPVVVLLYLADAARLPRLTYPDRRLVRLLRPLRLALHAAAPA